MRARGSRDDLIESFHAREMVPGRRHLPPRREPSSRRDMLPHVPNFHRDSPQRIRGRAEARPSELLDLADQDIVARLDEAAGAEVGQPRSGIALDIVDLDEADPGRVVSAAQDGGVLAGGERSDDGSLVVVGRRDAALLGVRARAVFPVVVKRNRGVLIEQLERRIFQLAAEGLCARLQGWVPQKSENWF